MYIINYTYTNMHVLKKCQQSLTDELQLSFSHSPISLENGYKQNIY